jgi:hypothetical protein
MKPERVRIGTTVRVREQLRIAERRGMVGRIADYYGEMGTWPWMCASRAGVGGARPTFFTHFDVPSCAYWGSLAAMRSTLGPTRVFLRSPL